MRTAIFFIFIIIFSYHSLSKSSKNTDKSIVVDFVEKKPNVFGNLHIGICRMYNDIDVFKSYEEDDIHFRLKQIFQDETFFGLNAGMDISHIFAESEGYSHEYSIGFSFYNFSKEIEHPEKYLILQDNQHKEIILNERYELKNNYLHFNLIYKFSFEKKHIGLFGGPVISMLAESKYKYTYDTDVAIEYVNKESSGYLDNTDKYDVLYLIGLSYTYNFNNYGLSAFFKYFINKRQFYSDGFWHHQMISFGIDFRYPME